jgi:transposase-like protein
MISVVCPYCGSSECILFDPCMDKLIRDGKTKYTCKHCGKLFIINFGTDKIETKEVEVGNESDCSCR